MLLTPIFVVSAPGLVSKKGNVGVNGHELLISQAFDSNGDHDEITTKQQLSSEVIKINEVAASITQDRTTHGTDDDHTHDHPSADDSSASTSSSHTAESFDNRPQQSQTQSQTQVGNGNQQRVSFLDPMARQGINDENAVRDWTDRQWDRAMRCQMRYTREEKRSRRGTVMRDVREVFKQGD